MNSLNDSYIGQIQVRYGHGMTIEPGVRIIVRDSAGRILLVRQMGQKEMEYTFRPCPSLMKVSQRRHVVRFST